MSSVPSKMKNALQIIVAGTGSSVVVGGGIAAASTTLFSSSPAFAPIGQLTGLVILGLGSLFSFVTGIAELHS